MVRRLLLLVAMAASWTLTFAGCETLRQSTRSAKNDRGKFWSSDRSEGAGAETLETDPTKIQAVDADAKNPRPFFQNNRRSGGWSSEAREIESHLGVE
jgi:hypothetical protein